MSSVTGDVIGHNKALNNLWLSRETVPNALHLVYEVLVILVFVNSCETCFTSVLPKEHLDLIFFFFSELKVHPKVDKCISCNQHPPGS